MIITLCGSARFESEFKRWNKWLTLAGHIVITLSVYPSDEGGKDWYTEEQKEILDRIHREKIDISDAILVINNGAYIGKSTELEIGHAFAQGKRRFYTSIVPSFDPGGERLCPYAYCREKGNLFSRPPCAVCYE